ncbi:anion transporter [Methanofollis fontis]|uniref:Anion transporter n=2 Tax=Methanofollis fontis TaxID=2052832 RepID=A0A483CTG2_9EURY|nr:anion transporter [Methanofollis fontis]
MLLGAIAMLFTGSVGPLDALRAIDPGIMLFLFCMFIVGGGLHRSGLLVSWSERVFGRVRSGAVFIVLLVMGAGAGSALLMNDTLAVIGTPLVLGWAARTGIRPQTLLFALAFAVTTGSVTSPVGNPQNLLIATQGGMDQPFVEFFAMLCVPTIIALLLVCAAIFFSDRAAFHRKIPVAAARPETPDEPSSGVLPAVALASILVLIAVRIIAGIIGGPEIPVVAIAVAGAIPLLIGPGRGDLIRGVDWATLIFFAAMFVVMAGVMQSGAVPVLLEWCGTGVPTIPVIIGGSIIASQFISNVPCVALVLPPLLGSGGGVREMCALAAGSTIAGNLTVIGAASNVIICGEAERRGKAPGYLEFFIVGFPLTILQAAVYYAWLTLI